MSDRKYLEGDERLTFNDFVAKAATGELGQFCFEVAPNFAGYLQRNGFITVKQWAIVVKNMQPKVEREQVEVGDLSAINTLFDKARKHIKFPAIVLSAGADDDGNPYLVRLSVAGLQARVPGSINVTEYESSENTWYGRILKTGNLEVSPKVSGDPDGRENLKVITDLLQAFAADPVKVASEHGRLTGKCCFCHAGLKDERSTAIGYGPTCAKNYGLAWGKIEHEFEQYERPTPEVKAPPRKVTVRSRRRAA